MRYDAHVRARSRLITRIVNRRYEWGLGSLRGCSEQELRRAAAGALAEHRWHDGWGRIPAGPYHVFGPKQKMKDAADVPTHEIHAIMCHMPSNRRVGA